MRKSELKEELKQKRFYWFANDADGLSILDFLTIAFTLFYMALKVTEIVLLAQTYLPEEIYLALHASVNSVESIEIIIITYYFVKKGIDTTVSKVLLKDTKLKDMYNDVIREDLVRINPLQHTDTYNNNVNNQS